MKNNKNNNCNFPNLRFPEFQEEWEKYKVSDILEFFPTNSLSWEQLEFETDNIHNLHYGLIHKGLPTQIELSKCTLPNIKDEFIPNKYTICKEGDIAFADASEDTNDVAKVVEFLNCNNKSIICGLHTIHGRDKRQLTTKGFKGYIFSSNPFRYQVRRLAQGTKIYSINSRNFDELYISIPSKEEQTKIAHLLFLIDERIETQNKIIEEYKKLKNALAVFFFGTSVKYTSVGEICDVIMGQSPSSAAYNYVNNGLPLVQGNLDISEGTTSPRMWTSEITKQCEIGDIILTVRAPVGVVAKSNMIACVGRGICAIKVKESKYSEYVYQYLQYFKNKWISIEQGSTFSAISRDDILSISIPAITKKLTAASHILALFDNKINAEISFLKMYRSQKQFLLSKMFI
ncbi:MAG: restriction endonuclease subunit S [Prevotella sp.]|nr:restriction endonuclease subunit S [Prevotella sp.]